MQQVHIGSGQKNILTLQAHLYLADIVDKIKRSACYDDEKSIKVELNRMLAFSGQFYTNEDILIKFINRLLNRKFNAKRIRHIVKNNFIDPLYHIINILSDDYDIAVNDDEYIMHGDIYRKRLIFK